MYHLHKKECNKKGNAVFLTLLFTITSTVSGYSQLAENKKEENLMLVSQNQLSLSNEIINTIQDNQNSIVYLQEKIVPAPSINLNFVLWFMGTKQNPNSVPVDKINSKNALIKSGIAPNRLLLKAFLKKVFDFESVVG